MRKLASVQTIEALRPIPDAQKIEVAQILGWEVVTQKGRFKVGDLCVYIECDSILPAIPDFFFLEPRRYRIRIIKLKKQVSQGLALTIPEAVSAYQQFWKEKDDRISTLNCGDDVTTLLGIIKHDPQRTEEDKIIQEAQNKNPVHKFLLRFPWYRNLFKKPKGWPSWIVKTDEERIQNMPSILVKHTNTHVYWTEKLDGQSASYSYKRLWIAKIIPQWIFTVCSRNIWQKKKCQSNYWSIAEKYNLHQRLKDYNKELVIQGEIVGPGIQKNKYQLKELDFFVFNIFDLKDNVRLGCLRMQEVAARLGLKVVPILGDNKPLRELGTTVQDLVKLSVGKSTLFNRQREGIVVRNFSTNNEQLSFKVISPDFLLENDE